MGMEMDKDMIRFTSHELEIIEVALVQYMKRLTGGVFADRERGRIQVILEKIDSCSSDGDGIIYP